MDRIINTLPEKLAQRYITYKENKRHAVRIVWQPAPWSRLSGISIALPSSTLIASYDRIVAEDLSAYLLARSNDTSPRRVRDRVNALFRPGIALTIDASTDQGLLNKAATTKVLHWETAYWDDKNVTALDLGTAQPLVEAFQQLRAAKVLGVLKLEETLDAYINPIFDSSRGHSSPGSTRP